MPSPKISVIIRARNAGRTLGRVLEGIRAQTLQPSEIIVVDNSSRDDTVAIAQKFGCQIVDYPAGEPFNFSKSLNVGLASAHGDYCFCLSSHSILISPDTLELLYEALNQENVCGAYIARSEPGEIDTNPPPHFETISKQNFDGFNGLQNPCALIRRKDWEMHPFDETVPSAEDMHWAFWMFEHTNRVTICVAHRAYLYANPYINLWKTVRDTAWVAHSFRPDLKSLSHIRGRLWRASTALLRGKFDNAKKHFAVALALGPFHKMVLRRMKKGI